MTTFVLTRFAVGSETLPSYMISTLTRAQVAQILGISVRSVIRREKDKTLNPIRLGSRIVRFDSKQINELINKGAVRKETGENV